MNDTEIHVRLSTEKMQAAADEYNKKRYAVVGDLTIKAVEQAIAHLEREALETRSMHIIEIGHSGDIVTIDEGANLETKVPRRGVLDRKRVRERCE